MQYENYAVLDFSGNVLMIHLSGIDLYPGEAFKEEMLMRLFNLKMVKFKSWVQVYKTDELRNTAVGVKKLLKAGIKKVMVDEIIPR